MKPFFFTDTRSQAKKNENPRESTTVTTTATIFLLMQNLPPEVVHAILAYVGLCPRAIRVCHQWRDLLCALLVMRPRQQSPTVDDYMRAWARADAVDMIRWARQHGCPWSPEACTEAAHQGNLSLFQWLRDEGCPWDNWACTIAAASGGHLEVIARIMADRPPLDEWICAGAAMRRQSVVLDWMCAQGHLLDNVGACQGAARGGHLDLLIQLREQDAHGMPSHARKRPRAVISTSSNGCARMDARGTGGRVRGPPPVAILTR
ncbi:ankyrin repeat protein [Pandoravirus inopinatum]|uniref:Ankyrin repeat protein n=1 Tax=Pandoravirus inopinatum TaxID=1605721 RepID=A0A0B5IXE8_9VIRU|nr:ankyrin repeat protein [Pandoravirus inopinatum]AJF97433.1 ankyrin repeat protein [Pandoravirus inopinatum]